MNNRKENLIVVRPMQSEKLRNTCVGHKHLKAVTPTKHILHQLLPEEGNRSYNLREQKTKF